MKTPPETNDPLLQSLVDEAKDLPQSAAAQARSRQHERAKAIRVSATLVVLLFGFGFWLLNHTPEHKMAVTQATLPSETSDSSVHQGYVRVYQEGERPEAETIPPDASERERKLLTELPGIPLLIVKNEAGQITRVQIFER